MHSFIEFVQLHRLAESLRLLENVYPIASNATYDPLFAAELRRLAMQVPRGSKDLESLEGFGWTRYIARSVQNSGVRDAREVDEWTHDIAAKLLLGGLFNNYDPKVHGPLLARFKTSVTNALRSRIEKLQNQRRYLPRSPISSGDVAAKSRPSDESTIQDFRSLVGSRIGPLGLAVLDSRLSGADTKTLIGSAEHGSPSAYRIKQVVLEIKRLAHRFAMEQGDDDFLRQVERAMQTEEETVKKRVGARQFGSEVTG